jgi:hypothetical protein
LLTECAGTSDEEQDDHDVWYVVAEYATNQRSSMDTVEIVKDIDICNKAENFMHKQDDTCSQDTLGKQIISISSNR